MPGQIYGADGRLRHAALTGCRLDATTHNMLSTRIQELERSTDQPVFARLLLQGEQCNVGLIRLGPGQTPPPHRHGSSELMLYAVSGAGELDGDEGAVPFGAGALPI